VLISVSFVSDSFQIQMAAALDDAEVKMIRGEVRAPLPQNEPEALIGPLARSSRGIKRKELEEEEEDDEVVHISSTSSSSSSSSAAAAAAAAAGGSSAADSAVDAYFVHLFGDAESEASKVMRRVLMLDSEDPKIKRCLITPDSTVGINKAHWDHALSKCTRGANACEGCAWERDAVGNEGASRIPSLAARVIRQSFLHTHRSVRSIFGGKPLMSHSESEFRCYRAMIVALATENVKLKTENERTLSDFFKAKEHFGSVVDAANAGAATTAAATAALNASTSPAADPSPPPSSAAAAAAAAPPPPPSAAATPAASDRETMINARLKRFKPSSQKTFNASAAKEIAPNSASS
jgi:hypothetical protein